MFSLRYISTILLFGFLALPGLFSQGETSLDLDYLDALEPNAFFEEFFVKWEQVTSAERGKLLEKAKQKARDSGDKSKEAKTLLYQGYYNYGIGNHEKANEYYLSSLNIYKSLEDFTNIGLLYNELSILTKKQKNYEQAKTYLQLSSEACKKARDSVCLSTSLDNLGMLYVELGDWEKAEALYNQVLSIREIIKDSVGIGFVLTNLAECEANRGAYEEAVNLINRSTAIRKALGHEFWIAVNDVNVGEMYAQFGDHKSAVEYYETSLNKAIPLGYTDLIQYTLNALAKSYTKLGNYEQAYQFKEQASVLKDSLFNENQTRAITEMQAKYETERHKLEANTLAERNTRLIAWGSALLAGILLLGSIIYFRIYQKQKYERRIKEMELHDKVQNERHRISRDLHDNVGSQLTNIITNLDILGFKAEKSGDQDISNRLEKVGEFARNTMSQLRETIWAINKESFTVNEFAQKVRAYLSSIIEENESGITWNVQLSGGIETVLSPGQALNMFRIVQEATNNMIKYAKASEFHIELTENGRKLQLDISDNGIGFDTEIDKNGHYGLENMRHRAKEIGATIDIKSVTGKGTKICLDLTS